MNGRYPIFVFMLLISVCLAQKESARIAPTSEESNETKEKGREEMAKSTQFSYPSTDEPSSPESADEDGKDDNSKDGETNLTTTLSPNRGTHEKETHQAQQANPGSQTRNNATTTQKPASSTNASVIMTVTNRPVATATAKTGSSSQFNSSSLSANMKPTENSATGLNLGSLVLLVIAAPFIISN